ncbi:hypothetical protein QF56_004476 [Salmonella enterica subsp. enterica]|nr:hypothetical protein [Salmonella enterica subsp. enterica serovar Miami]
MTEPLHLVLPGRSAPVRFQKIRLYRFSDLHGGKRVIDMILQQCKQNHTSNDIHHFTINHI